MVNSEARKNNLDDQDRDQDESICLSKRTKRGINIGLLPRRIRPHFFFRILSLLSFLLFMIFGVRGGELFSFQISSRLFGIIDDCIQCPLVSVIFTISSVHDNVEPSLTAVLTQKYKNLQVIIVDDTATGNVSKEISELIIGDDRVRHLRIPMKTYGGAGISSNVGLDRARGKYIAFVNSRTVPKRDFLTRMVATAESSNADITICQFKAFDTNYTRSVTSRDSDSLNWPNPKQVSNSQAFSLSPKDYSGIFFFNPVPWRNLYKANFIHQHSIRFPEGDFVYDDTLFHWHVLLHTTRIAYVSKSFFLQKPPSADTFLTGAEKRVTERDTAQDYDNSWRNATNAELLNLVPKLNAVGHQVSLCSPHNRNCDLGRKMFLKYIEKTEERLNGLRDISSGKIWLKVSSVFYRDATQWQSLMGNEEARFFEKSSSQNRRMSIIIPTFNVENFLQDLFPMLDAVSVSNEVIFVDTSSTDNTVRLVRDACEIRNNWYILQIKERRAGLARNIGQLMAEGAYLFFFDGDDSFDAAALDSSVRYALLNDLDVLVFKYKYDIAKIDDDKKVVVISEKDMETRHQWNGGEGATVQEKKIFAATIPNFPWCKIVKRAMVVREQVFHGPSSVNNDVQYHWHSLLAANSVEYFDRYVVWHRFFKKRVTLTGVGSSSRLELMDALILTNRVLVQNGMNRDKKFHEAWRRFAEGLMHWGKTVVGKDHMEEYERRRKLATSEISNKTATNLSYLSL